ncbi:MAG: DUF721 domain-containing protein [Opitutales bacterium]|nr:DUF721 domain-containing protein [Opitutales bacterium]
MPLAKDNDPVLNEFRGIFAPAENREPPKRPGEFIDKIFLDCHVGKVSPLKALLDDWHNIAPKEFAHLCEPVDVGKNEIYVRAANSAARQELMFCERQMLKKVRLLGGLGNIKKIRFV